MQKINRSVWAKAYHFFIPPHCSLLIPPGYSLLIILRDRTKSPQKPCLLSDMRRVYKDCPGGEFKMKATISKESDFSFYIILKTKLGNAIP